MPEKETELPKKSQLIGEVTHYFNNIGVGVINLTAALKVGDTVRIIGGEETDFTQKVKSMELEHEKIETAKKGGSVGFKVDQKVREGYKVYKV